MAIPSIFRWCVCDTAVSCATRFVTCAKISAFMKAPTSTITEQKKYSPFDSGPTSSPTKDIIVV